MTAGKGYVGDQNPRDILIIYEEDSEEWALYLKSIFKHITLENRILLYNIDAASLYHLELQSLCSYRCKLLILSSGLLNCLDLDKSLFLEEILQPPENVVILLCGVENSAFLHEIFNMDKSNQVITTNQNPEVYLAVIAAIIQRDLDTLPLDLEHVLKIEDSAVTESIPETLERPEVLVLPRRISCENPEEIFILLRDEVPSGSVEIEFMTENQRIRTQPNFWNQNIMFMKTLDFPAGIVNVIVYCEGVIKATTQIEYYTAAEEIECMLQKVADPVAFACQASKFSSAEKIDKILTFLLTSPAISYYFSDLANEDKGRHHQQTGSHLEELPTLLHCAAKFGLKKLATVLLQHPGAIQACKVTNKYGESPACVAEKHGQKEIQEIIKELSIHEDDYKRDEQEEEKVNSEDDVYMIMMRPETHHNGHSYSPRTREQPGVCREIQHEAEAKAEAEVEEEEGMTKQSVDEEANKNMEESYQDDDSLYATIDERDPEANTRDMTYSKGPPLPPRFQLTTPRQEESLCGSPEQEIVKDKKENKYALEGLKEEDISKEGEEEDPYTAAQLDDSIYDAILASATEKRRKDGRSFIMNRPPAPAPRPSSAPVKEEVMPYIAQVFQQKATRISAANEKVLYAVRKPDRVYDDKTTYTTVRPNIPLDQEQLILLQEDVKKGIISVDEAVEKFKQWQNHKSRLEATQQEKMCQLQDSITRKTPEEEDLHVSMKKGGNNLNSKTIVYSSPFRKQRQHAHYSSAVSAVSERDVSLCILAELAYCCEAVTSTAPPQLATLDADQYYYPHIIHGRAEKSSFA
ncbi:B-cell scaffold protein with ankyrin repeats [Heteronotia binoei]|uniref:B-cell scaffold protein with ankyrin repeats n=1 Tax=Heteronotia binoei TaxID=13085 RepID=UPI0029316A41|nr:B-cell scaffold protein with ankyrin repeats [Heteronotia binoei]